MTSFKLGTLMLTLAVALPAACTSNHPILPGQDANTSDDATIPGQDANTTADAAADVPPVVLPGTGGCGGTAMSGEVPPDHRAVASACAPSTRSPAIPDSGLASCATDADCAADGGLAALFATCLHRQCSFDHCLTDADCGATGVCVCANDYYGGNGLYHANVCVPGNCRVDADCGPGGACSPSRAYCGSYTGYYCHTPNDSCVDATKDCASCGLPGAACIYTPTTAAFVCGSAICAG